MCLYLSCREPGPIFQSPAVSWHKIHLTLVSSVHFCKTKCLAASPTGTGHLWSAVAPACSLCASVNQGQRVWHQTSLVGQLHLSHMNPAMGQEAENQQVPSVNITKEELKTHDIHPASDLVRLLPGPRSPKIHTRYYISTQ